MIEVQMAKRVYLGSLIMALGWILLVVAPPLLVQSGAHGIAIAIYGAFSLLCHQIPERTFRIDGLPLAVCSRCTALYAGVVCGLLTYPLARPIDLRRGPSTLFVALAFLPMLVDFGGEILGIFHNTFFSRSVTGLLAGIALAFLLLPALVAAFDDWRQGSSSATIRN